MNGSRFQERRTDVSDENNHARTLKEQRATITSATRPFPERKAVASVNKAISYQHSAISKRQKLNADSRPLNASHAGKVS